MGWTACAGHMTLTCTITTLTILRTCACELCDVCRRLGMEGNHTHCNIRVTFTTVLTQLRCSDSVVIIESSNKTIQSVFSLMCYVM